MCVCVYIYIYMLPFSHALIAALKVTVSGVTLLWVALLVCVLRRGGHSSGGHSKKRTKHLTLIIIMPLAMTTTTYNNSAFGWHYLSNATYLVYVLHLCLYLLCSLHVFLNTHIKLLRLMGWHYLCKATCLIQPHLFYALFAVSRIIVLCYIIRHV